jgi:uncharacterized RDD family membrane protein YckC
LFPSCYGLDGAAATKGDATANGAVARPVGETTHPVTLTDMATTSDPQPPALDHVASWGRRFGALLIDWVLCTVVASFLVDSLRANPWPQLGLFVLAHAFFVGLFGQTAGMALFRIRCVSIADSGAVGIPRALLRALLLALVVPAMISDGDGRGVHDRVAGSVVVTAG